MHELGIVFHVIKSVEKIGEENGLTNVASVTLELGEVSGAIPHELESCWNWAVKKTELLPEAALKIETIPAVTYCEGCGRNYPTVQFGRTCPHCGSEKMWLKQDRTFLLNLMSSPGSGKTTTLLRTLEALKDELRIGVMEADIDSDVDAKTIADAGVKSIQLHTGGMCHLDASMTEQGLKEIGTKDLDLVVLENVGNLVCPAEFDTGAVKNAMILSVPEGHDKPLKYPLIFTVCDALIINKIDVLPYFDFDMEKVVEYAHMRNPKLKIFPLSAKTGEGVDAWCNWLREQVRAWNG